MIRRCSLPAVLSLALLVPATAVAATVVSGSKSDRKGDTASHGDLVRASATYRSGGALKLKVSFASYGDAAAQRTIVGGFFARRDKSGCNTRRGSLISFESDTKRAESAYAPGGGKTATTYPARARVKGNTATLTASNGRFANRGYDCVVVVALDKTTSKDLDKVTVRLKR